MNTNDRFQLNRRLERLADQEAFEAHRGHYTRQSQPGSGWNRIAYQVSASVLPDAKVPIDRLGERVGESDCRPVCVAVDELLFLRASYGHS